MNKELLTSKNHPESSISLFQIDELKERFFLFVFILTGRLTNYCRSFFCFNLTAPELQLSGLDSYSFSPLLKNLQVLNIYTKYPICLFAYFDKKIIDKEPLYWAIIKQEHKISCK